MAINQTQRDYFQNQKRRISKTSYIRFDASERLSKDDKFSVVFSSILSLYLICNSVVFFVAEDYANSTPGMIVSFIGIISAMTLLAINLLDHSENRAVKSKDMLENAKSINQVAQRLDLELNSTDPEYGTLSELVKEYHKHLDRASLNHSSRDNRIFECSEKIKSGSYCHYIPFLWEGFVRFSKSKWLSIIVLIAALLGFWLMLKEAWIIVLDAFGA